MRRLLLAIAFSLLCIAGPALAGEPPVVRPELQAVLDAVAPGDEVAIIITLADRLDPAQVSNARDRRARRSNLTSALRQHAVASQAPLLAFLRTRNARNVRPFWIFNGVAATVPAWIVPELARHPGVASIRLDETVSAPAPQSAPSSPPEWNLGTVRAPELWALGFTGAGTVVASMDTGVDALHPDLAPRWRGGSNSWFDPHGQHGTPSDALGHGTQVTGLMVGGGAGGTVIGVAPDARWIAVKIFNDSGVSTLSAIHQGFEWLLDPDGNPETDDAPDVVNNSWHLDGTTNQCTGEFAADIAALKAAGIAVVFAAGNTGPAAATSVSPPNDPAAVAVGAVDPWLSVGSFSSRGPSACDGGTFPRLAAPGVAVRSADLTFGGLFPDAYATVSGTSFSAPHVAGGMALLLGAMASRGQAVTLAQLEAALADSALDLGVSGPDNDYGMGLLDLVAAYNRLLEMVPPGGPAAAADAYAVPEGGALSVGAAQGVLVNDAGYDTPPGAVLVSGPARAASFSLHPDGSFSYVHDGSETTTDAFVYRVSSGSATAQATVTVTVTPVNDPPVAATNSYSVNEDTLLSVPAPGVLGNDSDPEGGPLTAVLVTGPANGALTLNADGSFSYKGKLNFFGTDSFTYQARDAAGALGGAATVAIAVNPVNNDPPVSVADSYSTPQSTPLTVAAPGVLANDYDPDGQPLTAQLRGTPANGTVSLKATGGFTFTPTPGFVGTASFQYRAQSPANTSNRSGNTVTVTITVTGTANTPPLAANDSFTTAEDTPLSVSAPGVLANDSDPEGAPITAVLVAGPASGTVTLSANGSFTYTPAANFSGSVSFTYRASDGSVTSNVATVTIGVTPVNDAPVATADTYSVAVGGTLSLAAPGVLANDADPDGGPLTAALIAGTTKGSLTLNADGSFTYVQSAAVTAPTTDSFTYQATDGALTSPAVTVTITIAAGSAFPTGLVLAYNFDEPSGPTVVNRVTPGTMDGTISGATRAAGGRYGAALLFDGVNDRVDAPDHAALDLTAGMTLSAWVNPSALGADWRTVMLKETTGGLVYALYASDDPAQPLRPAGYVRVGGTDQAVLGPSALPLDAWTHLAVTYGGGSLRLFVNGTQVATRTLSGTLAVSGGQLRIGGNAVWGEYFQGMIDDVRVYARPLSAGEIVTDMNTPLP